MEAVDLLLLGKKWQREDWFLGSVTIRILKKKKATGPGQNIGFLGRTHNNSLHPGVSKGSKKLLGNARGSLMMDWHHVQVELLLLAVYIQYFFFHRIIIEVDIMLETRQIKLRQVLKTNIIW